MSRYSDFYTHEDVAADLDDRDDQYDPEFRQPDDYCKHGRYIGNPFGAGHVMSDFWDNETIKRHMS